MALFDVPGWSMPLEIKPASNPVSRKRKRDLEDTSPRLHTAEVNVEKLMEKLSKAESSSKRKEKKGIGRGAELAQREDKLKAPEKVVREKSQGNSPSPPLPKHSRAVSRKKDKQNADAQQTAPHPRETGAESQKPSEASPHVGLSGNKGRKRKKGKASKADRTSDGPASEGDSGSPLTHLQAGMKQNLDGARFRWINETLYKSESREAERLMHENPALFQEYHIGFRHQVTSWPTNPVDHFIKTLTSYPERSVIVDLGCGDAALARNLIPKGYSVLSFDLISANSFIVAADICGKLHLPGSETENDEGQVVDVVVCCLSLMNSNWLNCIREAARVLRKGAELKIAEVASRITDIDKFTSVICSIGFRLVSRDERNSHFTLFDFKKTEHSKNPDDKVWQKILSRGDVLQPCEYKKR